jgi:hypothetical protein
VRTDKPVFPGLSSIIKTVGIAETIAEGQNRAWNGAHLKIQAGAYPEKLILSKPLKLVAKGGNVTIGK